MPRSVLLRHDLPDGSWHFDWLIDPVGEGAKDDRHLITFRLTQRPDGAAAFDAVRLLDHRRLYLDFEGMIEGEKRGSVTRTAEWNCQVLAKTACEIHVRLELPNGPISLRGMPVNGGVASNLAAWRFEVTALPA